MSDSPNLRRDINFLFEMGSIRFIDRMWRRFLREDFANLAEHHFRTFWIAMIIAQHEGNVDVAKVAKMALMHDISESRTGDVDYLSRQYVIRNEELAIDDMLSGTALEEEFHSLWEEYEQRSSREAQIVKDADNLDCDFELAEQSAKGSTLPNVLSEDRKFVASEKLYTKTAKLIFEQLATANPHEWHYTSRTRRNAGDWKS